MKCSLGISSFLEEISSLSPSIDFLYFFALITESGFIISPCYSLELWFKWVYLCPLLGTTHNSLRYWTCSLWWLLNLILWWWPYSWVLGKQWIPKSAVLLYINSPFPHLWKAKAKSWTYQRKSYYIQCFSKNLNNSRLFNWRGWAKGFGSTLTNEKSHVQYTLNHNSLKANISWNSRNISKKSYYHNYYCRLFISLPSFLISFLLYILTSFLPSSPPFPLSSYVPCLKNSPFRCYTISLHFSKINTLERVFYSCHFHFLTYYSFLNSQDSGFYLQ